MDYSLMFSRWLLLFCILLSLGTDAVPINRDTVDDDSQNVDKQRQWEQEQRQREEVQVDLFRIPLTFIVFHYFQ